MSNNNEHLKIASVYGTNDRIIVNWDILEDGKVVERTCSRFADENKDIFLKQTGVQVHQLDSLVGKIFVGRTYTTRHDDILYVEPASLRMHVTLTNPVLPETVKVPIKEAKVVKPAVQKKVYDKKIERNARIGIDYLTSAKLKITQLIDQKVLSGDDLQSLNKLAEKLSTIYQEQSTLKSGS
jgi:hypothetical protein